MYPGPTSLSIIIFRLRSRTNNYTLNWINNQPGQAQEFLSSASGRKTVYTYLYLQGSLEYNRKKSGKVNVGATLIGTRQQKRNTAMQTIPRPINLLYCIPSLTGISGYRAGRHTPMITVTLPI